jgi:hypothetical protein
LKLNPQNIVTIWPPIQSRKTKNRIALKRPKHCTPNSKGLSKNQFVKKIKISVVRFEKNPTFALPKRTAGKKPGESRGKKGVSKRVVTAGEEELKALNCSVL